MLRLLTVAAFLLAVWTGAEIAPALVRLLH